MSWCATNPLCCPLQPRRLHGHGHVPVPVRSAQQTEPDDAGEQHAGRGLRTALLITLVPSVCTKRLTMYLSLCPSVKSRPGSNSTSKFYPNILFFFFFQNGVFQVCFDVAEIPLDPEDESLFLFVSGVFVFPYLTPVCDPSGLFAPRRVTL